MAAITPAEASCSCLDVDEEKLMELRELLQDGAAEVDVGLEEGFSTRSVSLPSRGTGRRT